MWLDEWGGGPVPVLAIVTIQLFFVMSIKTKCPCRHVHRLINSSASLSVFRAKQTRPRAKIQGILDCRV